ncbi:hypothetical protein [Reyranella sp.]|uniref:hypothetical protein n=1 Tax=Reyranella sp. TaxID=1929291 RepID=UPI00273163B7|nr:hypothetical protein [Reyranella sp.]MDP2373303.1 hypothetical protein [Reyranella sp.]
MSDYSPDPRQRPDPLNYRAEYAYQPVEGGRSSFAIVGIVAALALIGGLLFFGSGNRPNDQQAMQPPAVTETPATPAPVAPRQE